MNSTYSVVIEDDVWIGANVTILSGAHLSKGVVVVAGSVVSGFVKPYNVIIGNPARTLKNRLGAKNDKI
jgi:acetyltransferase-like isoleucine patch superfamily enzyme